MHGLRVSVAICVLAIAACAIAVSGCGDDSAEGSGPQSLPLKSRPKIEVPTGLPPKKLVVKDLWEGTGIKAQKGDKVRIQYYGVDWRSGLEHANSWRYARIPVFTLGEHRILRGMNQGIRGMKEGGAREILIPHNLVYYPGGNHIDLSPLDALIYRVYLVDVID
jgi:FKBP-type peptidyl-prolyl cis-trans isomerase